MRAEAEAMPRRWQAAAQQVLARGDRRAGEKLGAAPDDAFVLTPTATVRWDGDARGQNWSQPTTRCIRGCASSPTSGSPAPRARLSQTASNLWLKTHVEKLLGPLFALSKAEDVTGIARGIAFQLVEALGVIERNENRRRDEGSRSALARAAAQIWLRFGAYHIYFPGFLKTRRALARLAAVGGEAEQCRSFYAVQRAASGKLGPHLVSGRQEPACAMPIACSATGQCGERAVRVDILERLADLIRPALAWRVQFAGAKPTGRSTAPALW